MSPKGGVIDMGHARLGRTVRSMAAGLIDRRSRVGGGVGATGLPAQAATPVAVWAGTQVGSSSGGGPGFVETGQGQGAVVLVGTGSQSETVAFSCEVVAVGVVESTGVACYMVGQTNGAVYPAPTVFLPGNAAATAGHFTGAVQSYKLCIQHNAISFAGQLYPQQDPYCISPQ